MGGYSFKDLSYADKEKLYRIINQVIKYRKEIHELQNSLKVNEKVYQEEVYDLKEYIRKLFDLFAEESTADEPVSYIYINRPAYHRYSSGAFGVYEVHSMATQTSDDLQTVYINHPPKSPTELQTVQAEIKYSYLANYFIHQNLNKQKQDLALDNIYQRALYQQHNENELNNYIINNYLRNLQPYREKLTQAKQLELQLYLELYKEQNNRKAIEYNLYKAYPETHNIMKLKRYNIISMYEPVDTIKEMFNRDNIVDYINGTLPQFVSPGAREASHNKELVDKMVATQDQMVRHAKYHNQNGAAFGAVGSPGGYARGYDSLIHPQYVERLVGSLSITAQQDDLPPVSEVTASFGDLPAEDIRHGMHARTNNLLSPAILDKSGSERQQFVHDYKIPTDGGSSYQRYFIANSNNRPTKIQHALGQLSSSQQRAILSKQSLIGRQYIYNQISTKEAIRDGREVATKLEDMYVTSTASNSAASQSSSFGDRSVNDKSTKHRRQEQIFRQQLEECYQDEVDHMIDFINAMIY